MLTLEKVKITYEDFQLKADWFLAKGQILCLIGPSGAGKSTLLNAIAGFQGIDTGAVRLNGQNISKAAPGTRALSLLFQDHNLFPHLTVAENVGVGLKPDLKLNGADLKRVGQSLSRVNLQGYDMRKPASLSGGQRQRVALARALLRDKPLMMLDEPFAALGPALKDEMLDLVQGIAHETGATVIMVTHRPEDAKRIADCVSLVSEGLAHVPVPTNTLFQNPPAALKAYLGT